MKSKQTIAIAAILIVGVITAALILSMGRTKPATDEHGHAAGKESAQAAAGVATKGPHGGKLFTDGDFGLEITVFEQGTEPEFRLYPFLKGKPLDPASTIATVVVERLGRKPEQFTFAKAKDYLKANAVVEEPHSFEVTIAAQREGKTHRFNYTQAESRAEMTEAQVKQAGIEIKTAGPAKIKSSLQLLGEIKLNGDRTVLMHTEKSARVSTDRDKSARCYGSVSPMGSPQPSPRRRRAGCARSSKS